MEYVIGVHAQSVVQKKTVDIGNIMPYLRAITHFLSIQSVLYVSVTYLGFEFWVGEPFFVLGFGIIWHCLLSVDSFFELY